LKFVLFFFIPSFLTLTLTPVFISVSTRYGLLDYPDARKNHAVPTPLAGGLILFPLVLVATTIGYSGNPHLPLMIAAAALIFFLGIVDDFRGVHFSTKFLVQITAAFFVMQTGALLRISGIPFLNTLGPDWGHFFTVLITLGWIVGVTNAVNLIDGIDGLASGLSFNAFMGMGVLSLTSGRISLALFCLMMAGGLLGFLRFNLNPARAFLGDSGSMLLGFTFAVVAVLFSMKTTTFLMMVVPALLLSLPMADTTFSFVRRTIKGKNPFKPDRRHLHHRLLDLNFSVKQVLGFFFGLSTVLGILTLWLNRSRDLKYVALAFFLLSGGILTVKIMQIVNFHARIRWVNRRIRGLARKATEGTGGGAERFRRNLAVLFGLSALNLALTWITNRPGKPAYFLIIAGLLILGSLDYALGRKEKEKRYEIMHTALFLSWVMNQSIILAFLPGSYIGKIETVFPPILVFLLLGFFLLKTGTVAVFLQDPMEVLALFTALAGGEISRNLLGELSPAPVALAVCNGLVLYILSKMYMTGYWRRSPVLSVVISTCSLFLLGMTWTGG